MIFDAVLFEVHIQFESLRFHLQFYLESYQFDFVKLGSNDDISATC